jgi:hypothetical protein
MSISLIFEVLLALFKFPTELGAFVRLISKSPEEKRQEILKKVQAESDALDQGGRPVWEDYTGSP